MTRSKSCSAHCLASSRPLPLDAPVTKAKLSLRHSPDPSANSSAHPGSWAAGLIGRIRACSRKAGDSELYGNCAGAEERRPSDFASGFVGAELRAARLRCSERGLDPGRGCLALLFGDECRDADGLPVGTGHVDGNDVNASNAEA